MSRSTRQYAAHLAATGKPNLSRVVAAFERPTFQPIPSRLPPLREAPTLRPPASEVTPAGLRDLASELRADASRWLARANDLEAAAKRLEGE